MFSWHPLHHKCKITMFGKTWKTLKSFYGTEASLNMLYLLSFSISAVAKAEAPAQAREGGQASLGLKRKISP